MFVGGFRVGPPLTYVVAKFPEDLEVLEHTVNVRLGAVLRTARRADAAVVYPLDYDTLGGGRAASSRMDPGGEARRAEWMGGGGGFTTPGRRRVQRSRTGSGRLLLGRRVMRNLRRRAVKIHRSWKEI